VMQTSKVAGPARPTTPKNVTTIPSTTILSPERPPRGRPRRETCPRGHNDWYTAPSGIRSCRTCARAWDRSHRGSGLIDPFASPPQHSLPRRPRSTPALEWFLTNTVVGPVPEHAPDLGPCLLWTHRTTGRPGRERGVLTDGSVNWIAARWAFTHFVGSIPEGWEASHLCHTPLCVNAEGGHIVAEPNRVNVDRSTRLNRLRGPRPLSPTCRRGHNDWHVSPSGARVCATCKRARGRIVAGVPGDPFAPAMPRELRRGARLRARKAKRTDVVTQESAA